MTSNIGARKLKDFGQGVGFGTAAKQSQADAHAKSVIENALKKTFAPEFLNRVDDVMVFNALDKEHIHKIIDIELENDRKLDNGCQKAQAGGMHWWLPSKTRSWGSKGTVTPGETHKCC